MHQEEKKALNKDRVEIFMRLYQANELKIYGFIRSLVPNWNEADDLVQNTTIVLWSKFDNFELGTNFIAWALKIARIEVMRFYKKKKEEKMRFSQVAVETIADKNLRSSSEVSYKISDQHEALHRCIGKLSEKDREILTLRYEAGASTESVAKHIGRGIYAVYKKLNVIHTKLLFCIRRTLEREELI